MCKKCFIRLNYDEKITQLPGHQNYKTNFHKIMVNNL